MDCINMRTCLHVVEVVFYITFFGVGFVVYPMGDGDDSKRDLRAANMENLSSEISRNRFSRDLLQRFMGSSSEYEAAEEEGEEIELNLGLSLGGRFGVDQSSKKLVRSSSIAECIPLVRDDNDAVAPPVTYNSLVRTSSLPVETEEEWRKRKELQTLRRMEAKRRRSEKLRILKGDKEGSGSGGGNLILEEKKEIEVNLRAKLDRDKCLAAAERWAGPPVRLSSWTAAAAAAARQALLEGGIDVTVPKGKGSGEMKGSGQQMSQGSLESQGGSSSSMSELESKPLQGGDEPSPASVQSLQEGRNRQVGSKARENTSKKSYVTGANMMEDMPCVFTKGDGPNGRRVDGILYKYGKGAEVRIMCVCHGSFLSPAEFIKHAGGTDVDHPLKHIVVNPNSPSLL